MKAIALIVFLSLFGIGFSHQQAGAAPNSTCGCNAACEKGFLPSKVTKCVEDGVCLADKKDSSCTLTCTKGKEEKTVTGSCVRVYTARPVRG